MARNYGLNDNEHQEPLWYSSEDYNDMKTAMYWAGAAAGVIATLAVEACTFLVYAYAHGWF